MALQLEHGGNLAAAAALFPEAPQPWIDLSTGINPHSYPLFDLPATALTRLPEQKQLEELKAVAALAYGAPSAASVVAAPGTQILLPRIASLVKPGRALVLGPTYAEHARAAALAGHSTAEVNDFEVLFDADLAIVVNPNNPDGRVTSRTALLSLAASMAAKGGLLVTDEAFMDVGPRPESVAGDVPPGLVLLRSFGKFFGLAGVRLGFAISEPSIAARLEEVFGPWAVGGPALHYGLKALADRSWQDCTRQQLSNERARLDAVLSRAGLVPTGGTDLFRHLRHPDAQNLFTTLGEHGILVRRFAERPDTLRLGLPADDHAYDRLERALNHWSGRGRHTSRSATE